MTEMVVIIIVYVHVFLEWTLAYIINYEMVPVHWANKKKKDLATSQLTTVEEFNI